MSDCHTILAISDELIQTTHEGLGRLQHHPVYRTYELVSEALTQSDTLFEPSELLSRVKTIINECVICQKFKKHATALAKQYRSLHTDDSYATIGLDFSGPYPTDTLGNKYILTIKDHHDKFVQLYATPNKDDTQYIKALLQYCANFGIPRIIRTDQDNAFTSHLVHELNESLNIKHSPTLPYTPTGNSIVERNNTEVLKRLRYYITHDNNIQTWSLSLPLIQLAINNSYNRIIGMSPFRARFGDKAAALPILIDIPHNPSLSLDYTSFINESIEVNRTITNIISDQEQSKLFSKNPATSTLLKKGMKILVKNKLKFDAKLPSKFSVHWLGPYEITAIDGNTIATIHCTTGYPASFDISKVKIFHGTDESATAANNIDDLLLPKSINDYTILHHRGDQINFALMQFYIEYANGINYWVPWSYVHQHTLFPQYCRHHNLNHLLDSSGKAKTLSPKDKATIKQLLLKKSMHRKARHSSFLDDISDSLVYQNLFNEPNISEHTAPKQIQKRRKVTDIQAPLNPKGYSFTSGDYNRYYSNPSSSSRRRNRQLNPDQILDGTKT